MKPEEFREWFLSFRRSLTKRERDDLCLYLSGWLIGEIRLHFSRTRASEEFERCKRAMESQIAEDRNQVAHEA